MSDCLRSGGYCWEGEGGEREIQTESERERARSGRHTCRQTKRTPCSNHTNVVQQSLENCTMRESVKLVSRPSDLFRRFCSLQCWSQLQTVLCPSSSLPQLRSMTGFFWESVVPVQWIILMPGPAKRHVSQRISFVSLSLYVRVNHHGLFYN